MRFSVIAGRAKLRTAGWCSVLVAMFIGLSWLIYLVPGIGDELGSSYGEPCAGEMLGMNQSDKDQMPGMDHLAGMPGGATGMGPMPMPMPMPMAGAQHTSLGLLLVSWIVMSVAMMGAATLPTIQCVEQNTVRSRRGRAVLVFIATWLAVWSVAGLAVSLMQPILPTAQWGSLALALGIAALWQLSPWKRGALTGCQRFAQQPPHIGSATRDVAWLGLRSGALCVRSCWAVMTVMLFAPAAHLWWMIFLTVLITYERFSQHPRRAAGQVAMVLAAAALAVGGYSLAC